MTTEVLEREIYIAARPEVVFAFFVDPVKLVQWKGQHATLEPRPGGLYRVDINGRDVARGQYLEVTPFTRVVFTWGWEGDDSPLAPGASTVEITLTPERGGTHVQVRHLGLPTEPLRHMHGVGWDAFLPRLLAAAEGRRPPAGIDPMRPPAA